MRELFVHELRTLLGVEQRLAGDVLPRLREQAHATDLVRALDRHRLETDEHVANLRRVLALVGEPDVALDAAALPEPAGEGDLALLAAILRTEALETAAYTFVVHAALALAVDGEAVHLLRLNLEQDAYAGEEAERALAKLLAEKVESGTDQVPKMPTS